MNRTPIPYPQRLPLARLPTPIQAMTRLGQEYGIKLYLKRDDQTGMLTSGNKIRKLEFLVREALEEKAKSYRRRPRSWGVGASGHTDTAIKAGDMRPEPRSWR